MTEKNINLEQENEDVFVRKNVMVFDKVMFSKLVINELNNSSNGRSFLKKYKQSEVRELIEGYKLERNQEKLREISQILFAKSPQYQRLLRYFSDMALFAHVITPIKDIRKATQSKVLKQYIEIGELVKTMNLKHEMQKVLRNAFCEDAFFGYVYKDKKSFYIQKMDASICKITSVEDGVYNYSINMLYFQKDEKRLVGFADEIKIKYYSWKKIYGNNKSIKDSPNWMWVELDAENTICIKINEEILEIFPPFAGSFDAIFDIEAFKELRKNKEEIDNYMMLAQELPMRKDSENNNDFMIDRDMMMFFHNMASDTVPDNVGVITSPMKISPINFSRDRIDTDGVAKAERDFWSGNGTSQLLFNADKSTSQGLLMSIKTDEEIVFGVLVQIQRWLNRYLGFQVGELMFNVEILPITHFNRNDMFTMYMSAGQFGIPIKSHLCATIGLNPIETMNMAYLENDILKMHEQFIPLISSHTLGAGGVAPNGQSGGRPPKPASQQSDETQRSKDKPNA